MIPNVCTLHGVYGINSTAEDDSVEDISVEDISVEEISVEDTPVEDNLVENVLWRNTECSSLTKDVDDLYFKKKMFLPY